MKDFSPTATPERTKTKQIKNITTMKHLRKSILTLLALTLFGGAGAWAQGQLLTTINASSGFTNGTQTFDNIVTVTLEDVAYDANYGWYGSGSPRPVEVSPVNGVTVTGYMLYFSATAPMEFEGSSFTVALRDNVVKGGDQTLGSVGITKIEVYGYAAAQEIELTKAGANQWTLGQTPDYDLELQVEYYEAHALKDIPAGWTVKVNDIDKTADIDHDSLMITETDSVTLIPAGNPRRVKSVTLADDVPPTVTFTVKRAGGSYPYTDGTYTVAAGTTWQQFLESGNAPACLSINGQWILHDFNANLHDCGGTNMVNTADNKYIRPGDAIIDGATYACDSYVGYQGHF